MIITKDFLEKNNVCREGILWFKRNFKTPIDFDKVEIIGDYKSYISWLEEELKVKREYDKNGNKIKEIWPSGVIYEYEYDESGNIIKEIWPSGDIYKWEYDYDERGNLIELKENRKIILKIKYL